jgi:hypothetical protein
VAEGVVRRRKERQWEKVCFCVEMASLQRLEISRVDDGDEYCEPPR